ncbi:hypothetical protein [Pseudoalteromonas aurantia]|uniref:Uncharacterized protein n=1 Tax=Pseudoalteromonas aurantia 208 TaxID=1314867 RepID=A0ABR9E8I3_9GAMM|nr:hypothetical protein [Pseudoalteromonas aurantia]MBE0367266.1 hypothetical protein [Pseudoalteromonas aurantia 208]
MSKQAKKQSLLGQTQRKQSTRKPAKKNKAPTPSAQTSIASDVPSSDVKSKKKIWVSLSLVALLIILFPKPQLITYEKLGLVAQSIYWSGLPGYDPVLLDSKLHPRSALHQNILYLCVDKNNPSTCQRYQVIEQKGVIPALLKLILD